MKSDAAKFVNNLSTGESRILETSQTVTTITDSEMEVGACHNEFCDRVAEISTRTLCDGVIVDRLTM